MTKTSHMTLMSFKSNDPPVTFLWKSVHVISAVLWLWYLLKIQWSRWCNKVTLLSLCLYCAVFWYITLVTSTYVWKMDPGPNMLWIRFCPQNRVWQICNMFICWAHVSLRNIFNHEITGLLMFFWFECLLHLNWSEVLIFSVWQQKMD
jgi:hypothetical protein